MSRFACLRVRKSADVKLLPMWGMRGKVLDAARNMILCVCMSVSLPEALLGVK